MTDVVTQLIHPLVQDWQYGDDGYYYWDPEYHYEFNDKTDSYYNDWTWEDLEGGFPVYNDEDIKKAEEDDHWFEAIYYFRYLIDIVFIAVPWFIYSIAAIVFNYYVNIEWNNVWAEGNLWLIYNTLFLELFCFHSWALAIEWPAYLEFFRVLRWFYVWHAFWYVFIYALVVLVWTD